MVWETSENLFGRPKKKGRHNFQSCSSQVVCVKVGVMPSLLLSTQSNRNSLLESFFIFTKYPNSLYVEQFAITFFLNKIFSLNFCQVILQPRFYNEFKKLSISMNQSKM